MASNLPLHVNIIDCPLKNDDPHSLQAHVSLSKVHGEDGMVMEAQGLAKSVSPSILNANISNVNGRAREDVLIHDTYSTHSWVDRAEEGEFIPQVALDLEAEFRGFSEDPSFLMDYFHGDSSFPSLRRRRNLNNGSHGGCRAQCGTKGLTKKGENNQYPLGTSVTFERAGGPSQDHQKVDGTAISSSDLGSNRREAIGDQLVGNVSNQVNEVQAVQGGVLAQKEAFSELICSIKKLSYSDVRGGNTLGVKRVQLVGNVSNQGNEEQAVQGGVLAQKEAFSELICSTKKLSYSDVRGSSTLGVKRVQLVGNVSNQGNEEPVVQAMGGNSDGAKEDRPLDNRGNQEGGVGVVQDLLTATNWTILDLKCASKGLSFLATNGGKLGLPNRLDIRVENVANPKGISWSQVVNNNVQHKGFTLEYVAPCVKEDKVPPLEVLNEGNKMWATTLVGYFLDQK
ncbi:hypothetical protein F0562_007648 [Nyssa sinensis]|uniref:Uncharacterized protein n=1 Tax=Nyssa sinensis TaxID=561372 RepID=A0A5J5A4H8_9ASTE|nr:hypothetical protein F0562_007648 [Nyssa sinensis]